MIIDVTRNTTQSTNRVAEYELLRSSRLDAARETRDNTMSKESEDESLKTIQLWLVRIVEVRYDAHSNCVALSTVDVLPSIHGMTEPPGTY